MLAFHFPPFAQSSGSIRTLSFVRQLPSHRWRPVVLTAGTYAYPEVDDRSLSLVPPDARVIRAVGLDVGRHLAIAGRYPTWLATPDRWNTWAAAAFISGLAFIRRHGAAVLWATFPIASALSAAMALHRLTKIPFIADLRDPMVYEGWPHDRWMRATYGRIEKRVVTLASAVVVTTPGAKRLYVERYREVPPSRFRVIANGIDDAMNADSPNHELVAKQTIVLVHSGLMEIPDRDPTAFFEAIAQMRKQGDLVNQTLRVVLRATGRDEHYRRQIEALGIGSIVFIEARISYPEAVQEMRRADGLLLFQGAQCNRQIPAKAYEYLACRRPIIGLIDSSGDTHDLVAHQWKVPYIADMDSALSIAEVLRKFISDVRRRDVFVPDASLVKQHSRAVGAGKLAQLFDEVTGNTANA